MLFGGVNVDAFFHGVRQRPLRGFRAAALFVPATSRWSSADHHQKRRAGESARGKARLAEAAQYVPLEQICLSPQCGFASTEEGMPSAKTSNGKGPSGDLHRRRRLVIAFLAQRCTVMSNAAILFATIAHLRRILLFSQLAPFCLITSG